MICPDLWPVTIGLHDITMMFNMVFIVYDDLQLHVTMNIFLLRN